MFQIDVSQGVELVNIFIIMGVATVLGLILSSTFRFTHRKQIYDRSFITTLIMLPLVIAIIVLLVNSGREAAYASAFTIAGIFALVRFRTALTDTRDITYILSTVAMAFATSLGYIGVGIILTLFISLIYILISLANLDEDKAPFAGLLIVIPENINYTTAFKDIFDEYLISCNIERARTTDFGALYELSYLIKFKKDVNEKEFIDKLRTRNSNLNITIIHDYALLKLSRMRQDI